MIACVPSVSAEVVNVATPAESAPVPITVAPSLKLTVPLGVPAALVTVAVNVTACPTLLGLSDEASAVVVAPGPFTVMEAEAVPPTPPSMDVIAEVVLLFTPALAPVTLI